jgi:hypothetical protein
VIPRRRGDFERNDEVYERVRLFLFLLFLGDGALDLTLHSLRVCSCQQLDMDKDRTKRTEEEMADEAALLARYFDHSNTTSATSP